MPGFLAGDKPPRYGDPPPPGLRPRIGVRGMLSIAGVTRRGRRAGRLRGIGDSLSTQGRV